MSFLNPVNEPVLRFKSTDAGAPQINYNARVAGDVKAVLKACLVTGYGDKASAGWSVVNEVDHVAEFVSPSAAMSDYRLGVDDSAAIKTTWYYRYQDARVDPNHNAPAKEFFTATDKANPANGWQLLVTEQGVIFIELLQNTTVNKLAARITYWGRIKSALANSGGKNICFFNIGYNAAIQQPRYFYSSYTHIHTQLSSNTSAYVSAATSSALASVGYVLDASNTDLVSPIYLVSNTQDQLLGELPAVLSKIVNNTNDVYGVTETNIGGRNAISVCAGYMANSPAPQINSYSRTFLIYLDYWEY